MKKTFSKYELEIHEDSIYVNRKTKNEVEIGFTLSVNNKRWKMPRNFWSFAEYKRIPRKKEYKLENTTTIDADEDLTQKIDKEELDDFVNDAITTYYNSEIGTCT